MPVSNTKSDHQITNSCQYRYRYRKLGHNSGHKAVLSSHNEAQTANNKHNPQIYLSLIILPKLKVTKEEKRRTGRLQDEVTYLSLIHI